MQVIISILIFVLALFGVCLALGVVGLVMILVLKHVWIPVFEWADDGIEEFKHWVQIRKKNK